MDVELQAARSHARLMIAVLIAREKRLQQTKSKLSLHYNTVAHTRVLIGLVEELQGVLEQDPQMWEDEPDIVPF